MNLSAWMKSKREVLCWLTIFPVASRPDTFLLN